MFSLKQIFGQKKPVAPLYHFVEINAADLGQYPHGLKQVQNREIDGIIIRDVFAKEEVNRLLRQHSALAPEEVFNPDSGLYMYPQAFSQLDQNSRNSQERLSDYFLKNTAIWNQFADRFKVDFILRVKETLEALASGKTAAIPKGINGSGTYSPATFKEMTPGEGNLVPHCGNFFQREFPFFYTHLSETSIIKDQLSYFVMLQTPESGGELVLYDLEWKDAEVRLKDKKTLEAHNGKHYDLENPKQVKRQFITPHAGDMVVFSGGTIWHRVAYVKGATCRKTIGGFLTRSKDDQAVYFWS